MPDTYVPPVLIDYGSLVELTRGIAFRGIEDGQTKLDPIPHHSLPSTP